MREIRLKLKPDFWEQKQSEREGPFRAMFNFRKVWKLAVLLMSVVTILPLAAITLLDYQVTQKSIESEIMLRTARIASNAKRNISFFLNERKAALDFLVHDNSYENLNNETHLAVVLENLKKGFGGGFEDIGVIDSTGRQQTYVGPFNLKGKNYSDQAWFKEVVESGIYISDVFLGYRNVPHLVIAVKYELPGGGFYVLRSALDTGRFNEQLSELLLSGRGDAFLINNQGILQTPARYFGHVFQKCPLPVPEYSEKTQVIVRDDSKGVPAEMDDKKRHAPDAFVSADPSGTALIIGYAYIPGTPFILMIVKVKDVVMKPWRETRAKLIGFLFVSITIILIVILGVATYLVNSLYLTDQKRLMSCHEVEYTNKMASIGRLAAGIAHEINNPLAIINEKAGLIKDLFTFKKEYAKDERLINTLDAIVSSVERCATITKRLLNFSRQPEIKIQTLYLETLIREVLGFTGKEAEYRSIQVVLNIDESVPEINTDRGKLQQIFLNLITNAFAAMENGGMLEITTQMNGKNSVNICFKDNGCGIAATDLERIFEPFFSTKTQKGGTGLGLSITYNLVHEIGGRIEVESEEGTGTRFIVTIPVISEQMEEKTSENTSGR